MDQNFIIEFVANEQSEPLTTTEEHRASFFEVRAWQKSNYVEIIEKFIK